eukprot:6590252-Alexandrium_andersonii.AAC.1
MAHSYMQFMGNANAAPGTPVQGPGPIHLQSFGGEQFGGQSHYAPASQGPVIPPDMGGLGDFGGGWPR